MLILHKKNQKKRTANKILMECGFQRVIKPQFSVAIPPIRLTLAASSQAETQKRFNQNNKTNKQYLA